jgi:hypothetical protein
MASALEGGQGARSDRGAVFGGQGARFRDQRRCHGRLEEGHPAPSPRREVGSQPGVFKHPNVQFNIRVIYYNMYKYHQNFSYKN